MIEPILAPVSLGELIDKITILRIKKKELKGEAQMNITKELEALETTMVNLDIKVEARLIEALQQVNADLWRIEDAIRDLEREQDFGGEFIELARSVYFTNDRRAAIKKEINSIYGSYLIEEKSYRSY
jgi:hypothetical protein